MSPSANTLSTPPSACPHCGLRYQCVCDQQPILSSPLNLALLTHPNELTRTTNTGKLLQCLPHCQCHIWDRVNPPAALLEQIKQQPTYVVFPSEEAIEASTLRTQSPHPNTSPLLIILDGTWQEANKMLNKSPWLKELPKITLQPKQASHYALRRNQAAGNLCTCEVGIGLLSELNMSSEAEIAQLQDYFELFLKVYEEDRNHRVYKS
ncbi:tRNA-uridine aminocarboxypropyltransferase [Vibrio algicola]|uniref:tRNA-uridine aminocarboxypropyltransferase n=1 Tax=Vibrio algicola TaxID=2662262 RepID=A0A5Q0T9Z8_9VIBR|nr:tRNA-uridine aminocarboxypropyltransferase [Vibrio algicola]